MAKAQKAKSKDNRNHDDFAPPDGDGKVREYSGELPEQAKLEEEGDSISGIFIGMKIITLKDQNTNQNKDVRVYTFKNALGEKFAVLGRTMLDTAFDNVVEHESGDNNPDYNSIIGMIVRIERGKDTPLKGKRTLGNYHIKCWDQA